MFAYTPFATTDTAIIRSSGPVQFCKKDVLANFEKNSLENTIKKDSGTEVFFVNFAKFLIISFLKNLSDGCFFIYT